MATSISWLVAIFEEDSV